MVAYLQNYLAGLMPWSSVILPSMELRAKHTAACWRRPQAGSGLSMD